MPTVGQAAPAQHQMAPKRPGAIKHEGDDPDGPSDAVEPAGKIAKTNLRSEQLRAMSNLPGNPEPILKERVVKDTQGISHA